MSSYPDISNEEFYERIYNKYKKYKIPAKKLTFDQICFPKTFSLQQPQDFLADYINPKTPYKGILVFHRIGAGKTCTAVNIGEKWKNKRKIMVLTPASLKGNFRDELRSPCAGNEYLTNAERIALTKRHPSSDEYKQIIKKSDDRINKYYSIYSYNKFVELYQTNEINLKNTVLIVDEIQNMVSEGGTFYKVLYEAIYGAPSNLRIVLLSATPMFDKPVEIALTMNLLRIPHQFPTGKEFEKIFINVTTKSNGEIVTEAKNIDMFKEMIKGYVSYYRGAPPYTFPESIVKYVKCEMDDFQYRSYITVLEQEEKNIESPIKRKHRVFTDGQIRSLPNNFFIGTRVISNISFPNKNVSEKGYKSFVGSALSFKNLKKY